MERSRDLRRTTVSAVNGSPRRRQRISTLRDSTDHDRQMELQETVRLGDDREFQKRRRIDRSVAQQRSDGGESYRENSTDSSDEEYYEGEEEMRIHQTNRLSPASSSLSINRRVLRTFRSSPVLRAAADEMFGVPVPRRARSSSAKRLHEYCNSGSGGFGEDLSHRRFSPSPVSLIGSGDSMKKKMRSSERRTTPFSDPPKRSVIQDDIEIEVAEALFDLMKQSQSQSRSSPRQEKVDRDNVIPPSDELKMSKADGGKDENNAFSVQNEPSIKVNADTVLDDSVKERRKEGTVVKDKISDEPVQDIVSGDGFVNKVRVGSSKESESPSCVKVNACDIQDLTMTKAHYDAIIVDAKNETKLEIDLMASPLPSSPEPEREEFVDMRTDPRVITQSLRNKGETISKDAINSNQQLNLDVEKHIHETTQRQGRKEHKNQSPTTLLPFPFVMNSWPSVVPHQGYMPPVHPAMLIDGSPKSSMIMQPPQFKFSQPLPKRCATQQYLAQSIHCHQQLIKKSLSSGSPDPAPLSRSKSTNLKYSPPQSLTPGNSSLGDFSSPSIGSGKDKSYDAAVAFNAATSSKSLLQPASHQASASSFLNGSGYILPFGHHQAKMMAPASSSGSPLSASRLPVNLPMPNASTPMSFNLPMFPSNEAAPYMAMLQNNGSSIPMPPFKRGPPSLTFFNPSLYPSPTFNVTQNQQQLTTSHSPIQSEPQNANLSSHKQPQGPQQTSPKTSENLVQPSDLSSKSGSDINWKNGASVAPRFASHSLKPSNLQSCSSSAQPMNFAAVAPVSIANGGTTNQHTDPPQHGSKGRSDQIPQGFAFSFGSNGSAAPVLNFSSMPQTSAMFQMLPDMSWNGSQMIHNSNFQSSEGKSLASGGQSLNYSKADSSEISALSTMGRPKFDSLARNVNYLPSSFNGSQPLQTSLIQDHHMHQMLLAGRGQVKPIYASTNDVPSFHPKWEGSSPQLKTSQGQSHISFGNGPISAASYQGHQFVIKSEPMSSLMVGLPSNSSLSRNMGNNLRSASTASALPSQEAEASQGGASQKSSPACRRNVPSILSMSPSKLPELKY